MSKDEYKAYSLIAIPCYNQLQFTKQVISTIKLRPDQLLLLINNGSTDGTHDYLLSLIKNSRIAVLEFSKNIGVANAWNQALTCAFEHLKCENCIILNNDILLKPNTIERMEADLKSEVNVLTTAKDVSSQCANEDDFFSRENNPENIYQETPDFSCFGVNKKCFDKIGYFDDQIYPAYFEDNDYHRRILLAGLKAQKNNNNEYWHYGSRTLQSDPLVKDWLHYCYTLNRQYYAKKWGGDVDDEKYTIPFNGAEFRRDDLLTFEQYKEQVKGIKNP